MTRSNCRNSLRVRASVCGLRLWVVCVVGVCWVGAGLAGGQEALPAESPTEMRADAISDWVLPGRGTNATVFGRSGRLLWGVPEGKRPKDGPRGLLRLFSPTLAGGAYDLVNFIAVEPIVNGRRGFSELERSGLDGVQGKRLWVIDWSVNKGDVGSLAGSGSIAAEVSPEVLRVRLGIERFDNGAQVELVLVQSAAEPDEIDIRIEALPDSRPMEYCILTATMGNKARARQLWLRESVENSRQLYPNYRASGFAPHRYFWLNELRRDDGGGVWAAVTTDESDPSATDPSPAAAHWRYAGDPVTQYWRKAPGTGREDVHVAVNARHTYWLSEHPIPGGTAFENFELRERYYSGQRFIFGITRRTPEELGFANQSTVPSQKREE